MPASHAVHIRACLLLLLSGVLTTCLLVALTPGARAATRPLGVGTPRMTVQVPTGAGWTIRGRDGNYLVQGPRGFTSFTTGTSALSVAATGRDAARSSGGTIVSQSTVARVYRARVRVGNRIYFVRAWPGIRGRANVSITGTGRAPRMTRSGRIENDTSGGAPRRTIAVTPVMLAQIKLLETIVETRRGGQVVPINVSLPMRLAVTPDEGARALVPSLPGWSVNTLGAGTFTVFHRTQGAAIFGFSPTFVPPTSQFVTPALHIVAFPATQDQLAAAAASGFQEVARVESNTVATVTSIVPIAGTAGVLGDGFISGMFAIRYVNGSDGRTYEGLILFGASYLAATVDFWQGYISFMAVPVNGPGGVANALIRSWSSWDGSPGRRLAFSTALDVLVKADDPTYKVNTSQFRRENRTWIDLVLAGG